MKSFASILAFVALSLGSVSAAPIVEQQQASYARTSAPAGAVVVDKRSNPVAGSYKTVQQGVDALSTTTTTPQYLFIYPGVYTEQVYVPALKSNLTIQGY